MDAPGFGPNMLQCESGWRRRLNHCIMLRDYGEQEVHMLVWPSTAHATFGDEILTLNFSS